MYTKSSVRVGNCLGANFKGKEDNFLGVGDNFRGEGNSLGKVDNLKRGAIFGWLCSTVFKGDKFKFPPRQI